MTAIRIYRLCGLLALLFWAGPVSYAATLSPIPQQQAKRFCRLLVCDNNNRIVPISVFIRQQSQQHTDSLTIEQLFLFYVVNYQGWQTLRIFPHEAAHGVVWYAPTDALPQDMSEEHRKYIHEVFPRLISEIEAGNWETVDAYIDRMLQYQCQFGGGKLPSQPSLYTIVGIFLVIPILVMLCHSSNFITFLAKIQKKEVD